MRTNFTEILKSLVAVFAGLAVSSAALAAKESRWDQIFLNGPVDVTLADGSEKTVEPSCSGGPTMTDAGPAPTDTQYSFFVQSGNPNKLLVIFDGGGACWDGLTCIGSPLAGSSTYSQTVDETAEGLAASEGIWNTGRPDNIYKNYTKVFIPFCTGDVHWGSRDTTYTLPLGPGVSLPWTIRHRGADNLVAVLDWLKRNGRSNYRLDLGRVRDLTVTGLSAGAYGTLVGFAYFAEETPRARVNAIADAGIGVLTASFYENTIYNAAGTAVWGVEENLPSWVPGFSTLLQTAAAQPNMLVPLAFQSLAMWRPDGRYASITADLDLVQVAFYALMKGLTTPGPTEFGEWYAQMRAITAMTASLPNYRYFIDQGTFHTFLRYDDKTYDVGVNGVSVMQWMRAMIKPGNRTWDSLSAPPPF